jgi:hypothetical protein
MKTFLRVFRKVNDSDECLLTWNHYKQKWQMMNLSTFYSLMREGDVFYGESYSQSVIDSIVQLRYKRYINRTPTNDEYFYERKLKYSNEFQNA